MFKPPDSHVITAPFTVPRFYQLLGARPRPKLVALWAPEAQRAMLDS